MNNLASSRSAWLALAVFTVCSGIAVGQGITLSVGVGQETSAGSVVIPIKLASLDGAQVSAIQWTLNYPSDIATVSFSLGTAAASAEKSLACVASSCVLYGLNDGAIPDGIVATATLQFPPSASGVAVPIQVTRIVAASPKGASIPVSGVGGIAMLAPFLGNPSAPDASAQASLTADSVSPVGNGGLSQTFSFVFSNSSNADVAVAAMLFSSTPASQNACFLLYFRDAGTIQLESDDLTSNEFKPIGSSSSLKNSQCSIGATSVIATPLSTTVNVEVAFASGFAGRKNIYMYGADTSGFVNSGWTQRGTYLVSADTPPVPSADSVSPTGGSRAIGTFTFIFSDTQDAANLTVAGMLFSARLDFQNSCYVVYNRSQGTLQLEWDDLMGADSKPVGSSLPLQNSQCAIGATSLSAVGRSAAITMDITFTGAFAGPKNIYMYGADGDGSTNTGWVQKGTWTPN